MTQLSTKDGEPVKNPGQILYSTNTKGEWSKLSEYEQSAWENSARDFLAALGSTVVTWIPVSERLPEKEAFIHVAFESGVVGVGTYQPARGSIPHSYIEYEDGGGCPWSEVTHWAEPLLHPEAKR